MHTVTEANDDFRLRTAFEEASLVVADGLPLVWSSRLLHAPIRGRCCGPDVMAAMLRLRTDLVHGFVGGVPAQASDLALRFGVRSVAYAPPMRAFSPENVREDVRELLARAEGVAPPIVWVGLGAPKQELWMSEAAPLLPHSLLFGVGAAFDFLTDTKRRALVWMQERGLEWLFRLTQEPRRLGPRYFDTNSRYIWHFARQFLVHLRTGGRSRAS